jgi:16S rRNA (cytosine967-C5)-methyltransferase
MPIPFRENHLFQILKQFESQHLPLDLFLSHYFRSHKAIGASDRRMIAESVYGMTRWKALLEYLSGSESLWEHRYAIYKGFQPNNYLCINSIPLHIRLSFPKPLFDLLLSSYGMEETISLCQRCNVPAQITVRINPLKTSREKLLRLWKDLEVFPCRYSDLGIQFKKRIPFFELPEFKEGLFEVQDEGSQLVADLIKAKPGDKVLDYCSGAGGKSLAFAYQLQHLGQIYLHDIRPIVLEQAKKRLKRAGIQNAQCLLPQNPHLEKIKRKMDWVLADVPCSGTGTLRRNPDMKWKFSKELVERLTGEQRSIFEKALSFVKPGGYIVYATCSLLKEENEQQLNHFLKTYPIRLTEEPFTTLPYFGEMDGFFAATFQKN